MAIAVVAEEEGGGQPLPSLPPPAATAGGGGSGNDLYLPLGSSLEASARGSATAACLRLLPELLPPKDKRKKKRKKEEKERSERDDTVISAALFRGVPSAAATLASAAVDSAAAGTSASSPVSAAFVVVTDRCTALSALAALARGASALPGVSFAATLPQERSTRGGGGGARSIRAGSVRAQNRRVHKQLAVDDAEAGPRDGDWLAPTAHAAQAGAALPAAHHAATVSAAAAQRRGG